MSSIVWWVAGVGGGNLHIGIAIGHFLADLVVHAAGDKLCEGADEGNLSGDGEAGGGAHHIGFGDAALDKALREFGGEGVHLEGALEVCRHGYYALIGLSGLQKAYSKPAAGVFLSCICILFHTKNLLRGFHLTV